MKPEQLTARALPKVVDGLLATAIVLALLYFGRDILVPVTLAFMLSFLIAPFVRTLREVGLGPTASVCSGVVIVTVALGAVAAVLVSQVAHLGANLSQHPEPIAHKLTVLDDLTRGALGNLGGSAGQLVDHFVQNGAASSGATGNGAASRGAAGTPLLVEIQAPALKPFQLLSKIAATAWVPVETAGIVFVVLIFILLEHESLRDRFIRLAGGGDLRATTLAVNDAGERLSRFFISQFLVNLTTGLVIWLGLSLAGLGQPLLWGAMTAVLRFVPYVGVWMAALCATLLAAATDPGWSMALTTLGLFLSVEVIVAQTIEPKLYGHTTGLSPLSVVLAAFFWSAIWGPVGLMLSTPLTLCLVVAGRYVRALKILHIMFGELPALTMPQNFYQRALSGDAHEIIAGARRYMQHNSLADYCDAVLLPALHLTFFDLRDKIIGPDEKERVTGVIIPVIEALSTHAKSWKKKKQGSVLADVGIGRQLRDRRIHENGDRQGAFDVPAGSVVLAVGLGTLYDELVTEILVRILREKKIDARSRSYDELDKLPPGAPSELVSIVCLVSVDPLGERGQMDEALLKMRAHLPHCKQFAVLLPSPFDDEDLSACVFPTADYVAHSYSEALQRCQQTLQPD